MGQTFSDENQNYAGDIVGLAGIASSPDHLDPPGLRLRSCLPNRGVVSFWVPNGTPSPNSDIGTYLMNYGTPYVVGPSNAFRMIGNYGPDGRVARWEVGDYVERGGVGVPVFFSCNGHTPLVFWPDGRVQTFERFQSVDGAGNPLVEVGSQGLLLQNNGVLKLVEVGAPDSGGPGKRMLTVAN